MMNRRRMKDIRRTYRVLRSNAGLTQIQTAVAAKLALSRYREIENGYHDPTDTEAESLKRVFGVAELQVEAIAS